MASLCKVQLIGNLGKDPEMRYTASGQPVTQFSLAVNRGKKNKETGEWTNETEWFRVTVWGDRGERAAEQLRKGGRVYVDGRFSTRLWSGDDGVSHTSLEVTADNAISLDKRIEDGEFGRDGVQGTARPGRAPADDTDIDDLPF